MLRFYHVSLITRCRIKVQQTVYCRHGVICLQREPASHSLNILFVRSYAILYMYVNIRVFLSSLDVARSIAIIDNCVASSHHPCNSSIDELDREKFCNQLDMRVSYNASRIRSMQNSFKHLLLLSTYLER